MATETRYADPPLIDAMLADGAARDYSFFQAVRMLELSVPGAARLGGPGPASAEAVRLRPDISLAYPRSSVTSITRDDKGSDRITVTQSLIGLYGHLTPMPSVYAEEVLLGGGVEDPVRDFLDMFHHRMLSLLYRGWARNRVDVQYRQDGRDPFTKMLFSVAGLPPDLRPEHLPIDAGRLARYAAHFARRSRPAAGLEAVLSDFIGGAPVDLEPYVVRTVAIPERQQIRLGRACSTLGRDMHLGAQVEDATGKFRLHIGPLGHGDFAALAPLGHRRAEIGALIHLYLGDALDHDVALGIRGTDKPACRLGGGGAGVRLGIDTWVFATEPRDSWEHFRGFPAGVDAPSGSERVA